MSKASSPIVRRLNVLNPDLGETLQLLGEIASSDGLQLNSNGLHLVASSY